jgi:[acyl-carrier-protein] S-malonyltransferase
MLNMTAEDVTAVCQQAEREVAARPGNTGWDFHGTPVCVPANYNTPGQIVISGHTPAVEQAIRLAKERGARRCIALPVSAPFHSPLMQPAADEMAVALAGVDIADLTVPVIPNVTALEITTGQQVRDHLIRQITGAVLWEASIRRLIDLGVDTFVELGTGRTLTGMLKRIDPSVRAFAVNGPDDLGSISGLVEDTAC